MRPAIILQLTLFNVGKQGLAPALLVSKALFLMACPEAVNLESISMSCVDMNVGITQRHSECKPCFQTDV